MEAEGCDPGAGRGGVRGDPGERVAVGEVAGGRRDRGPGPGPQGPAAGVEADPRRRGADPGAGPAAAGEQTAGGQQDMLPVLPDPVGRDAERALARWGLLGEGAVPVFTPGARYPLAGLLLALPALEATGLLAA